MRARKLPGTMYVVMRYDNNGLKYFVASPFVETLVEMGETIELGVYKLDEKKFVQGVVRDGKAKR